MEAPGFSPVDGSVAFKGRVSYERYYAVSMIPLKLDQVDERAIDALLADAVSESKTLEYKLILPGTSDSEKKEFAADVSALANTRGGDLIYGIAEDKGIPTAIPGLALSNSDREILRVESLINSGIRPRIRYEVKLVSRSSGNPVLIIRVDRSWNGPHRVEVAGHNRFYARTSTGKYEMDIAELRAAFSMSSTASERIRDFRTDRIIRLLDKATPVPFEDGRKQILHLIPLESFASGARYDVFQFAHPSTKLQPMFSPSSWTTRINLDGIVAFDGGHYRSTAYTQLYRTGAIEAVGRLLLGRSEWQRETYPHASFERELLAYLEKVLPIQRELGVLPPVAVCLSLTHVRGMQMANSFGFSPEVQEDHLILPEVIMESFSDSPGKVLQSLFDLIWNALGRERSANFDSDGNWIGKGF